MRAFSGAPEGAGQTSNGESFDRYSPLPEAEIAPRFGAPDHSPPDPELRAP